MLTLFKLKNHFENKNKSKYLNLKNKNWVFLITVELDRKLLIRVFKMMKNCLSIILFIES